MPALTCGSCADFPCDKGGGRLRSDTACEVFFKPWELVKELEDSDGSCPAVVIFRGHGTEIHCYIRYSASNGSHQTDGPIVFSKLSLEIQKQILDKILGICVIQSKEFLMLDLEAIYRELQAQHWYPKDRQNPIFKFFGGKNNTILNVKAVSEYILKEVPCKAVKDTGEVLYYENGIFHRGGERVIGQMVQNLLGDRSRKNHQMEVINWIKHATFVDREDFNPSFRLNCLNGVLNLCTGELMPHSPDLLFTIQHPVYYNPESSCPKISKFLSDILDDDKASTICEFVGYSLTTDTEVQKSVIVYGAAGAGKSTLLNLCTQLVGPDNVSNESLHSLENDRFAIANLCDKTLNVFPDLPDKPLSDIPIFKQIVGGDRLRGEMKYFTPFYFKPTIKVLFSANALPQIKSMDDAKSRRLILIRVKGTVPSEKRNRHLLDELTTPDELSGFLNLALKGLKRLWDSGHYSYEMSTEDTKIEYTAHSDPVKAFVQECIVFSATGNVKKKEMLEAFCVWSAYHGIDKLTEQQLSRGLGKLNYTYDRESTGARERYWEECSFSDRYYEIIKSVQDLEKAVKKLDGKNQEHETNPSNLHPFFSHCSIIEKEKDIKYTTMGEKPLKLDENEQKHIHAASISHDQDSTSPDNELDTRVKINTRVCVDCGCSEGRHQSVLLNKEVVYRCQSCWEKYQKLAPVNLPDTEVFL